MNHQIESAIQVIDELENFEEVSNILDQYLQDSTDLQSSNTTQDSTNFSLENTLHSVDSEVGMIFAFAVKSFAGKMKKHRDALVQCQEKFKTMEDNILDLKSENEVLRGTTTQLTSQVNTLQNLLDNADMETVELEHDMDRLLSEKRALKTSIDNLEEELHESEYILMRQSLKEKATKAKEDGLCEYKDEINNLREANTIQADLIRKLEADLERLYSCEEKHNEEALKHKELIEELQAENEDLKEARKLLQQELESLTCSNKGCISNTMNKNKLIARSMAAGRRLQRKNTGKARRHSLMNDLLSSISCDREAQQGMLTMKRRCTKDRCWLDSSEEGVHSESAFEGDGNQARAFNNLENVLILRETGIEQGKDTLNSDRGEEEVTQDTEGFAMTRGESLSEMLVEQKILQPWDERDFPRLRTMNSRVFSNASIQDIRVMRRQSTKTMEDERTGSKIAKITGTPKRKDTQEDVPEEEESASKGPQRSLVEIKGGVMTSQVFGSKAQTEGAKKRSVVMGVLSTLLFPITTAVSAVKTNTCARRR